MTIPAREIIETYGTDRTMWPAGVEASVDAELAANPGFARYYEEMKSIDDAIANLDFDAADKETAIDVGEEADEPGDAGGDDVDDDEAGDEDQDDDNDSTDAGDPSDTKSKQRKNTAANDDGEAEDNAGERLPKADGATGDDEDEAQTPKAADRDDEDDQTNSPTAGTDQADDAGDDLPAPAQDGPDGDTDGRDGNYPPLENEPPEAYDGELDPSALFGDVKNANDEAPDYTSDDPDFEQQQKAMGSGRTDYEDQRYLPVAIADDNVAQLAELQQEAAGVITTTARAIRRRLLSEEKRGIIRNRRDGDLDLENISGIITRADEIYTQRWARPAHTTELRLLIDASGSMAYAKEIGKLPDGTRLYGPNRLKVAVMAALATYQATAGTQIETSIYAFTGGSPFVNIYVLKDGRMSRTTALRTIGSYKEIDMGCTPLGEAMATMIGDMERSTAHRKVLIPLTDGAPDGGESGIELCRAVHRTARSRGVETYPIGIGDDSVMLWAPQARVINEISELPEALLASIDPAGHKRPNRLAA